MATEEELNEAKAQAETPEQIAKRLALDLDLAYEARGLRVGPTLTARAVAYALIAIRGLDAAAVAKALHDGLDLDADAVAKALADGPELDAAAVAHALHDGLHLSDEVAAAAASL